LREDSLLQIGQALVIPASAPQPAANPAFVPATPSTYTVAPGDTIISIALRFDLDWQALLRRNGLGESSTLQIGQVIQLR
jgi:LysM repeat protein